MPEHLLLRDVNVRSELFPFTTRDGIPTDTLFKSISYTPMIDELLLKIMRYSAKKIQDKWGIVYIREAGTTSDDAFAWLNVFNLACICGIIPDNIAGVILVDGSKPKMREYSNIYNNIPTLFEITGDNQLTYNGREIYFNSHFLHEGDSKHTQSIRELSIRNREPLLETAAKYTTLVDERSYAQISEAPFVANADDNTPNSTLKTIASTVFRTKIADMIHKIAGVPLAMAREYTEDIIRVMFGTSYVFPGMSAWGKRTTCGVATTIDGRKICRDTIYDHVELARLLGTDGYRLCEALNIWIRTALHSQAGRAKLSTITSGAWINRGLGEQPIDALLNALREVNDASGTIETCTAYLQDGISPQDILVKSTPEEEQFMMLRRSKITEEIGDARQILTGTLSES